MNFDKTVIKQSYKSQKYEESTIKPNQPKYKSQIILESSFFGKDGKSVIFNIFPDVKIGINEPNLPLMPMQADQDCQTTSSVKNKGEQLCLLDLKESLKIPREQTEEESSYETYEDN